MYTMLFLASLLHHINSFVIFCNFTFRLKYCEHLIKATYKSKQFYPCRGLKHWTGVIPVLHLRSLVKFFGQVYLFGNNMGANCADVKGLASGDQGDVMQTGEGDIQQQTPVN